MYVRNNKDLDIIESLGDWEKYLSFSSFFPCSHGDILHSPMTYRKSRFIYVHTRLYVYTVIGYGKKTCVFRVAIC